MSKEMTEEEIGKRFVDAMYPATMKEVFDRVGSLMSDVHENGVVVTAPEIEEPQKGEYKLSLSKMFLELDDSTFPICAFTKNATPETRRMMEKAKRTLDHIRRHFLESDWRDYDRIALWQTIDNFEHCMKPIFDYIQTGETGEGEE